MKKTVLFLIVCLFPFVQTAHSDEMMSGKASGPYLGLDAGFSLSTGVEFSSHNAGIPSRCDLHYAGEDGFEANVAAFAADSSCTGFSGSRWKNDYDKTSIGHTLGVTAGYTGLAGLPIRAEVEYIYRNNEYDKQTSTELIGAKLSEFQPEFGGAAYGRLGDIQSHNVFANVYYDIKTDSKFTPYVGAGVGWSRTKADLLHFFQRNDSGDTEDGTSGHPANHPADCSPSTANDCVLEELEGTVSSAQQSHEDDLFGFQVLVGFDYPLSDRITAGLKLRWAYFGELEGDSETWDTLRSHSSTVSPDNPDNLGRSNSITYKSETEDTQFWGAALSLKYHFNF